MKKILIATTALVATAGVASAEISLNGYGRFGLDYNGSAQINGGTNAAKTQVNMRMRVNFNASVETDSGVTFGGRIRMQYTDGQTGSSLNSALLFASYEGLRLEVGNSNTAFDSAALYYAPEIGYLDRSFGEGFATVETTVGQQQATGAFNGYSSTGYGGNRMGVFVSYSTGDLNARFSYVNPDQSASNLFTSITGLNEEVGISADYTFGAFKVSGAYVANGGFVDGNDQFFLGAAYDVNDQINVGLNIYGNGDLNGSLAGDLGETVTLYGSYTTGAIKIKGYLASNNNDLLDSAVLCPDCTSTVFGIGVDYDLGGARLSGDIHRNYNKDAVAGLGVRFDF